MPYREDTLPLQNYDRQNAGAIAAKLSALTQRRAAPDPRVRACRGATAQVVLDRIAELTADEPGRATTGRTRATIAARDRLRRPRRPSGSS